jgi:hypothetical protein
MVIFGACAGLCYNALWYFPLLIIFGGIVTAAWDIRLRQVVFQIRRKLKKKTHRRDVTVEEAAQSDQGMELADLQGERTVTGLQQRRATGSVQQTMSVEAGSSHVHTAQKDERGGNRSQPVLPMTDMQSHGIKVWVGLTMIIVFFGEPFLNTIDLLARLIRILSSIFHCYFGRARCPERAAFGIGPLCKYVSGRHGDIWWRTSRDSTAA